MTLEIMSVNIVPASRYSLLSHNQKLFQIVQRELLIVIILTWARLELVPAARAFLCSLVRWWETTGDILAPAPASLDLRELPGLMGSHGDIVDI